MFLGSKNISKTGKSNNCLGLEVALNFSLEGGMFLLVSQVGESLPNFPGGVFLPPPSIKPPLNKFYFKFLRQIFGAMETL